MNKVYLVCQAGWESYSVLAAYSTREKADEHVAYLNQGRSLEFPFHVDVMNLDQSFERQPIPEGLSDFRVSFSRRGDDNEWIPFVFEGEDERSRENANEGAIEGTVHTDRDGVVYWRLHTHVWATDPNDAERKGRERLKKFTEWEELGGLNE